MLKTKPTHSKPRIGFRAWVGWLVQSKPWAVQVQPNVKRLLPFGKKVPTWVLGGPRKSRGNSFILGFGMETGKPETGTGDQT